MPLTVAALVLPARSETEAAADRSSPSPVIVLSAGAAPSRPERASAADHFTVTSPVYQPSPFGAVVAAPLRVGSVLSTSTPVMVNGSLSLSAASVAVPSDLNQPLPLGSADRLPVTVGFVLSTLTVASSEAALPALSVAVPVTFCAAPSPLVTGSVQLAMPEPASTQVKVTVTSVLFHPASLAFGDCV